MIFFIMNKLFPVAVVQIINMLKCVNSSRLVPVDAIVNYSMKQLMSVKHKAMDCIVVCTT